MQSTGQGHPLGALEVLASAGVVRIDLSLRHLRVSDAGAARLLQPGCAEIRLAIALTLFDLPMRQAKANDVRPVPSANPPPPVPTCRRRNWGNCEDALLSMP